ncbi:MULTISPECIES: hypothetical protein [Pseudomonas]|uniref:Uncharacterized protein n=1 Tax=Pseudomonas lutea TaxID=243924 RepID=A0A9X8MH21_9PSED|nr:MULTISPECIES: hypothetical protein [Pseudomonas]SER35616.1 hypothetical protein SAMN05216409_11818 [Pseudomonas lutea]
MLVAVRFHSQFRQGLSYRNTTREECKRKRRRWTLRAWLLCVDAHGNLARVHSTIDTPRAMLLGELNPTLSELLDDLGNDDAKGMTPLFAGWLAVSESAKKKGSKRR